MGKDNFTIPNLSKNMRNSQNINKASQGIEDIANHFQITKSIKMLPPQSTSTRYNEEPTLISVHQNDFDSKIKKILSKAAFDPKKKTLVLHSKTFKSNDLKLLFLKAFPKIDSETILEHDNYPANATELDLQKFLKSPEIKIGIFQSKFVTGMEGSNVIFFYDAHDQETTSA